MKDGVDGGLCAAHQPEGSVPTHGLRTIHVVAGALLDGRGQVLIAQRPPGKHMAGGWEFPGGKLDAAELPLDGLRRELLEELGIDVQGAEWLASCEHDYEDRRVLLELWMVSAFNGEPESLDGQALRWVTLDELPGAGMLPADAPLVAALLDKFSTKTA